MPMHSNKVSELKGEEPAREPFPVIDDAIEKAQELVATLQKLGKQKHPLDVRRASRLRKEVENNMAVDADHREKRDSTMIKDGSRTYFIDVEKMSDGKPYLKITESRYKGEGKERERKNIIVFPEKAKEFVKAVSQMAAKLRQ